MNIIYKYPLIPLTVNKLKIPAKYKFLHVDFQQTALMLWILVDSDSVEIEKLFYVTGTGLELPEDDLLGLPDGYFEPEYIGTAVCDTLVWHVFHLPPIQH